MIDTRESPLLASAESVRQYIMARYDAITIRFKSAICKPVANQHQPPPKKKSPRTALAQKNPKAGIEPASTAETLALGTFADFTA